VLRAIVALQSRDCPHTFRAIRTSCDCGLWPVYRAHDTDIQAVQFLARDVIYTSRAYATMSVSVCLSVCL